MNGLLSNVRTENFASSIFLGLKSYPTLYFSNACGLFSEENSIFLLKFSVVIAQQHFCWFFQIINSDETKIHSRTFSKTRCREKYLFPASCHQCNKFYWLTEWEMCRQKKKGKWSARRSGKNLRFMDGWWKGLNASDVRLVEMEFSSWKTAPQRQGLTLPESPTVVQSVHISFDECLFGN